MRRVFAFMGAAVARATDAVRAFVARQPAAAIAANDEPLRVARPTQYVRIPRPLRTVKRNPAGTKLARLAAAGRLGMGKPQ